MLILWGRSKTYSGHKFFLTMVDEYTKASWTHVMVTKVEAIDLIKSFV